MKCPTCKQTLIRSRKRAFENPKTLHGVTYRVKDCTRCKNQVLVAEMVVTAERAEALELMSGLDELLQHPATQTDGTESKAS